MLCRFPQALFALALAAAAWGEPSSLKLDGHTAVCVRTGAGPWEDKAATEIARVLSRMSGTSITVRHDVPQGPAVVVGELALQQDAPFRKRLAGVAPAHFLMRGDAIAVRGQGQKVLLAGSNDQSHYFAAQELLRELGCRWYFPGDFGECLPGEAVLPVPLDVAYAAPFEVRSYWISWNGDYTGYEDFAARNFFNLARVSSGHALGPLLQGKDVAAPETAGAVAAAVLPQYAKGESISLSMDDATAQAAGDTAHIRDKYFLSGSLSDVYLSFYNRVCAELEKAAPQSHAWLGFLAYINLTLPPQKVMSAARPLICYLAPIDFDPTIQCPTFAFRRWPTCGARWRAG